MHFVAIVSILGAVLIGAISPGPSFVFVARTAEQRTSGLGNSFYFALATQANRLTINRGAHKRAP